MNESESERLAQQLRRELEEAEADRSRYLSRLVDVAAGGRGERSGPVPADVLESPAMLVLADRSQPDAERIELMRRLGASLSRDPGYIEALLTIVTDRDDSPDVRTAALRLLGSAAFQVVRFRPHRTAYLDALRELIDDPVPGLRHTAVSVLARENDDVVQQVLLDGLRGDRPLPVDRALAIELLAEDDHLDNLPRLQEFYRSDDEGDRVSEVRYMGSYPAAQDDLESVLRDKRESASVRQQSAASLRLLAPERFEAVAKEISVDTDDDPAVRAACLQTLNHLGDATTVYGDAEFVNRVAEVGRGDAAPEVAKAARDLVEQQPDS